MCTKRIERIGSNGIRDIDAVLWQAKDETGQIAKSLKHTLTISATADHSIETKSVRTVSRFIVTSREYETRYYPNINDAIEFYNNI